MVDDSILDDGEMMFVALRVFRDHDFFLLRPELAMFVLDVLIFDLDNVFLVLIDAGE